MTASAFPFFKPLDEKEREKRSKRNIKEKKKKESKKSKEETHVRDIELKEDKKKMNNQISHCFSYILLSVFCHVVYLHAGLT